ncbi:MAG: hypothetical protein ABSD38_34135 [Syntrophorhabdales bacterium]|jgi:hypothetical protein
MARKGDRKKRITRAAEEVWGRYACDRNILFNFNNGVITVVRHYRDDSYIRPGALRGVAANHRITVDELRIALAPRLLQEKLDRAMEG